MPPFYEDVEDAVFRFELDLLFAVEDELFNVRWNLVVPPLCERCRKNKIALLEARLRFLTASLDALRALEVEVGDENDDDDLVDDDEPAPAG